MNIHIQAVARPLSNFGLNFAVFLSLFQIETSVAMCVMSFGRLVFLWSAVIVCDFGCY